MKGIKSIIYEFNGQSLVISLGETNNVSYKDTSGTTTEEKMLEYLRKLYGITSNWKEEYINTKLIDSSNWKLSIIFTDGNKKEYRGKSSYPYNFESFERLNQELIDEVLYGQVY